VAFGTAVKYARTSLTSRRAIEMAQKFPHCDVLGLDLAPVPWESDNMPSNCRFEIGNINLGISHYHGCFDLIRVQCIGSGVSKSCFSF
jgi:hypothetical protein